MEASDLLKLIRKGENSKVQLKERLPNKDSIAQEIIAFSNTEGGLIIIGVNDKTGAINGLSFEEIQSINQLLPNIASQSVFPPVFITTDTVTINENNVVIVEIKEGLGKPYKDLLGSIYMKNGPDKRKVISNDEIARLLQSSKTMFADELPIFGASINDIGLGYEDYLKFIRRKYDKDFEQLGVSFKKSLESLNLLKDDKLTLAGLLFFCPDRQKYRPLLSVQCVAVESLTITGNSFTDNEPAFDGTLSDVFNQTKSFIGRNLKKIPTGSTFNSPTVWEIPYEVFDELIVNALVHRDYFINSTIKVFIYQDRVEIISPGTLPNSLTVENVKSGVSIPRNPILQTIAQHVLPYKGLGTGIRRAIDLYPQIEFINEQENERFVVIIKRKIN